MADWKDCGHCGSPAEHALHLKLHEVECRLFESERKLDTARLALRDIMSRANPQEWHFQRAHEALKEVGFPK